MKNRLAMKGLYKEKVVLEEELDNLTYLGNEMSYADYRERNDEIMTRLDEINKELGDN